MCLFCLCLHVLLVTGSEGRCDHALLPPSVNLPPLFSNVSSLVSLPPPGQLHVSSGFFSIPMPCRTCNGEGRLRTHCNGCKGAGLVPEKRVVEVMIPAGVDNNTNLRLVGQGDAGEMKGPRGHLWVKLRVSKGEHLTCA